MLSALALPPGGPPDARPHAFLTPAVRTPAHAEEIRGRVARYFGEAQWTDPDAFLAVVWMACWQPLMLEDEPFIRTAAAGGWRRWGDNA